MTRVAFESEFIEITGNGAQTVFHLPITPRNYLAMDVYEAGSLQSAPDERIEVEMVHDTEIAVRFAVPPPAGARYSLVLGWRA